MSSPLTIEMKPRSAAVTPNRYAPSNLADDSSHWLQSYPAHLSRTWTLASGESLRVRPVRHDDGALEGPGDPTVMRIRRVCGR